MLIQVVKENRVEHKCQQSKERQLSWPNFPLGEREQSFHHTNHFVSLQISVNLFSYSRGFIDEEYDGAQGQPPRVH